MKYSKEWFTLIEIIVTLTIISVVMVSIFTIFMLSNDINNKTDVSRALQENIKNIVENISEDVRINGIEWVKNPSDLEWCNFSWWIFTEWTKLCVWPNSYYLGKKTGTSYSPADVTYCSSVKNHCLIVKNDGPDVTPLSNSWIDFKELYFTVSKEPQKKVTINFTVQVATQKWISPQIIKNNKIIFQTTISERLYEKN